MKHWGAETVFFAVAAVILAAVVVVMAWPFLNTIALAAIMAYLFHGLFRVFSRVVRFRWIAALLTTVVVLVTILIPLSIAGYRIIQEAAGLYGTLHDTASGPVVAHLLERIQAATRSYLPASALDPQALTDRLEQLLGWMLDHLGSVFTGVTRIVLQFFFFLLFFFYLVRDGEELVGRAMAFSPLSSAHERVIMDRIAAAVRGTVRGQLVLSLLQGIVAGFGFAFFGVPNPVLWGGLVVVSSFIPFVGTSLVVVPCILYLLAMGQWASAVGLAIWGLTAIGLLDNALGPKLMSRGTHLHPLVTMVAVLGGVELFGPVGILMGPLLVALLFSTISLLVPDTAA